MLLGKCLLHFTNLIKLQSVFSCFQVEQDIHALCVHDWKKYMKSKDLTSLWWRTLQLSCLVWISVAPIVLWELPYHDNKWDKHGNWQVFCFYMVLVALLPVSDGPTEYGRCVLVLLRCQILFIFWINAAIDLMHALVLVWCLILHIVLILPLFN